MGSICNKDNEKILQQIVFFIENGGLEWAYLEKYIEDIYLWPAVQRQNVIILENKGQK